MLSMVCWQSLFICLLCNFLIEQSSFKMSLSIMHICRRAVVKMFVCSTELFQTVTIYKLSVTSAQLHL